MASWMIHFRVADALLNWAGWSNSPENLTAFLLGNIAPDSGTLSPDGRGYVPSKEISHFMRRFANIPSGENPERCDPSLLAEEWLVPALKRNDPTATAFYLGYLCHLVTDNAWVRDFIYPAKLRFAHLRLVDGVETREGVARFYAFLKKDWYDMDFLYIKHHPDLAAYHLFLEAEDLTNRYLPFFDENAFFKKREEIRAFYRKGVEDVKERDIYVSSADTEAFVEQVASEILRDYEDLFRKLSVNFDILPV